ncbi:hotdog domain-containing protein [Sporichthya sp.]|uniref:thioesterase family protein n=1 Tax=Sporichthya sp. TaxID=65475 RepID=UPI0025E81404|nr:hotdog domain-containing protein [Sporichthya sp.]
MEPGSRRQATVRHIVGPGDTASAVGSGNVEVLATPRLLALMEAATVQAGAAELAPGQTSVGTRVQIEHMRPSPVGAEITVHARLAEVHGRQMRFEVAAEHADGTLVASGQVTRAVVDADKFMARAGGA